MKDLKLLPTTKNNDTDF